MAEDIYLPSVYKYALVIGINYTGTSVELKGCVNDANNIVEYLVTKCGYLESNIKVLTDVDETSKPNFLNVDVEITRLVNKAIYNGAKELFLSYSGHGTYVRDLNGDEKDGRDECIVPLDYKRKGFLRDDRLNQIIRRLPRHCKLYCLFDCCFSGTILDLTGPQPIRNAAMISGCTDKQTSSESLINGEWSGAMTACFLECAGAPLSVNFNSTFVQRMNEWLKARGYKQTPVGTF